MGKEASKAELDIEQFLLQLQQQFKQISEQANLTFQNDLAKHTQEIEKAIADVIREAKEPFDALARQLQLFAMQLAEIERNLEKKYPLGYQIYRLLRGKEKDPEVFKMLDAIGSDKANKRGLLKSEKDTLERIISEVLHSIKNRVPSQKKRKRKLERSSFEMAISSLHYFDIRVNNAITNLLRKRYRRSKNKDKEYKKRKELEFGTKYDVFKSARLLESIPDTYRLREVEKTLDLVKLKETSKDPLDREIAGCILEDPEITLDKLAEQVKRPRSTVYDRLKKLTTLF